MEVIYIIAYLFTYYQLVTKHTHILLLLTITSKLLESVLLLKCSDYLTTCDNQFGFKASHGTDMCIYTLKEFID